MKSAQSVLPLSYDKHMAILTVLNSVLLRLLNWTVLYVKHQARDPDWSENLSSYRIIHIRTAPYVGYIYLNIALHCTKSVWS